jgi:phosphoserine aminotransferase
MNYLQFIRKFPVEVEILTSSGGLNYHEQVKEQKKVWLKKYGIAYKPHVVPGRKHKKEYATPETILIDDTEDVIDSFNKAGGIGILHKDVKETIERLESLLNT